MPCLIRTDTNEEVTLAGLATPDGRVLVTHKKTARLEVVDIDVLAVRNGSRTERVSDILAAAKRVTDRRTR